MPEDSRDDIQLMKSLVSGDQRALETIIERWEKPLYSFVYRYLQNETSTREIVQETFVRIFTKRERFNPDYPLSSWIFTIAANLCKNKARWHKRHPEVSMETALGEDGVDGKSKTLEDVLPSDAPEPGSVLEGDEELGALKAAVMSLPHDLRTAVLLHHYENLPYKEISRIVGCSVRGVETRLYRARKLLRNRMTQALEREDLSKKKTTYPISDSLAASTRGVA